MKKGFTLIELIATIILLAIISLIAFPTIGNIIENASMESFRITNQNMLKELEKQCQLNYIKPKTYFITNNKIDGFDFEGQLPLEGKIILDNDCNSQLIARSDKFCAIKNDDKIIITKLKDGNCSEITNNEFLTADDTIKNMGLG